MIGYNIKEFLDNKTWRLRHMWTHGHIAWKVDFHYGTHHRCIRCFRYQQKYDKREVI